MAEDPKMDIDPKAFRNAQWMVNGWLRRTFIPAICDSTEERALRLLEEALELAQAAGVTPHKVGALVAHVYLKPAGAVQDELDDVHTCLLVFAEQQGVNLGERIMTKVRALYNARPTIQRKWQEKRAKGLTYAAPDGEVPVEPVAQ